jgi:hypothetical protein
MGRVERSGLRLALTAVAAGAVGALLGAGQASAQTVTQTGKLTADCRSACGGTRGTGETVPSAFGSGVSVSADGSTALIGAPLARSGDGTVWVFVQHRGSWQQQGPPLTVDCKHRCGGPRGTGQDGNTFLFGAAVALSANGSTALIGAPGNGSRGGAWVFTRSHGRWSQQGPRLIAFCHPTKRPCKGPNGTGLDGASFGGSVALSDSGSTALIGAPFGIGGAWVFTRRNGHWSQQVKLVGDCTGGPAVCTGPKGTGEGYAGVNTGEFGSAVALSANGSTALIGAAGDVSQGADDAGAAWVFTRTGSSWAEQGSKLVGDCSSACSGPDGTGETNGGAEPLGGGMFGASLALSSDGSTALIGAPEDDSLSGGAWVFTRGGGVWSQQGNEIIGDCSSGCTGSDGTGEIDASGGGGEFGASVALTGDGDAALIGAPDDVGCDCGSVLGAGAVWFFERAAGLWSQQGTKLLGTCTSACTGPNGTGELNQRGAMFGAALGVSSTGSELLIGAPNDDCTRRCDGSLGNPGEGAAWAFALGL